MSVKKIIETSSDLNMNRSRQISNFIKNIAANKSIRPQRVPPLFGDKIIYCVTDSSRITGTKLFDHTSDINERFKTKNRDFTASYYEIWDKVPGTKQDYQLNRIYFHLYKSEDDKEYILLHTDPTDNDIVHGNYKRSPHLHIKQTTEDIISHAHFALNICDYDLALSNLDEINIRFKKHIDMLFHQILKE